ncbi:MAG: Gfo/Idh/MocA family oxidoreductase, partial [Candidatus Thorarchaeota archaeon]
METKDKPLQVMIIGAGHRGMYKYGELTKREDVNLKVVSVAEPVDEKREKMRAEHNIPSYHCFKSWQDALKQEKFCDAVIIATPDKLHHDIAIAALNKGYDIILEKPMATSPKECINIFKAEEKTGNVLSVAHVLRYTP